LNSFWQDLGSEIKRPLQLCGTSRGKDVMLLVSGATLALSTALVILVLQYEPHFFDLLLISGVLLSVLSGLIFFSSLANILLCWLRHKPPEELVPPFTLRGASKGGKGLVFAFGAFMLFSLFTVVFAVISALEEFDLATGFFAVFGLFLLVLFTTLFFSSWGEMRSGMSSLRVNKEGLQVLGSVHAREYCWSAIRKFRLNPTPIMLRVETEEGSNAFRRQEVAGNVKVVLNHGEFELPERYGMSPCDLRDLLNRARRIIVLGSDSPEGPEPFGSPGALTPVVQNEDLDSLRTSAEHLAAHGFSGSIVPFASLKKSERKNWISPARGGYVLCLSVEQDIQKAMQVLAELLTKHEESHEPKRGLS